MIASAVISMLNFAKGERAMAVKHVVSLVLCEMKVRFGEEKPKTKDILFFGYL